MSFTRLRSSNVFSLARNVKRNFSSLLTEPEYTEKPEYPPILDTSVPAVKVRLKQSWHEKIKSIKTVEEKLIEVNMPRYYGWYCYMLTEDTIPYNSLPFAQHITRTHIIEDQDLPAYYTSSGILDQATEVFEKIKSEIEDAILFEYKFRRRKHELSKDKNEDMTPRKLDEMIGKDVLNHINRIILKACSLDFPHLLRSQIECDPRTESFWFVGGIELPARIYKMRNNLKWMPKERVNAPIDRAMQFLGSPVLHVRNEHPLPPVVDLEESFNSDFKIPEFKYDPRVLGLTMKSRHGTNIPGFWPGDQCEFGLLSYHHRGHLLDRPESFGEVDKAEALHVQAILASYGWLLSQACYQGFSTFNDVTYPLVTQTVLSNGQYWSFYVYQLNTTLVHSEHFTENPRCNLCWGTGTMKLFEAIEDGKIIGLNDDVLKKLLVLYLNPPGVREGVEMTPYLGENVKHVADIPDDERREWLEKTFKYMYSNRPRARLGFELYHWEKIYKIDHKTRQLEARKRPFELEINPYKRRYDEHCPEYIPKVLRDEDKKKQKWRRTYYP